jgi:hypothetical protein
MEAKNESSFSGGSSREINAVSKADQDSLLSDLRSEISDGVLDELKSDIANGKIIIDDSLTTTEKDLVYSGKVGDEATSLKLTMNLRASLLTLNKDDVSDLARNTLESKVPNGFVLRDDQLSFEFDKRSGDSDDRYTLKVSANLLPQVDTEKVRMDVRGKYPPLAKDYFVNELPGFVRAEITLSPPLPGRLGTLPRVANRIEIQIASER